MRKFDRKMRWKECWAEKDKEEDEETLKAWKNNFFNEIGPINVKMVELIFEHILCPKSYKAGLF